MSMDRLFTAAKPSVPVRAIHLDLKGTPPTVDRLMGLLKVIAAARYNAVVAEWEDTFPWTVDPRFRCETAYTPEDVRRFVAAASELGIEVISLVQCLGHMETPLSVPGYEHLREVPAKSDVLNPLAAGARELVEKMVEDVLALTPSAKRLHLGGDEAWSFGTHPDTKAYVEKHGRGALYLHHIEPILDHLNARGVRPILWHDMMRSWDDASLRRLAAKADLCVWGYGGEPLKMGEHINEPMLRRFRDNGVTMWGTAAYKGADGHSIDLPNIASRQFNALGWVELARQYKLAGIIATAWSRYATHEVQCEPIDGALDSLLNIGVILHDGKAPAGGIEACVQALAEIGERERFQACRDALKALTDARARGWQSVPSLREQLVMATLDGRRRSSGGLVARLAGFQRALAEADSAAAMTRNALAGVMEPIWIDRYLAERIEPLREEYGQLAPRVRALDPVGYAGAFPA